MRRISILGATGSVGRQALDLLRQNEARGRFQVVALTGGQNVAELAREARAFSAEVAVTADPARLPELRAALAGSGVEAAAGPEALIEASGRPADWVLNAIVGAAGLAPGYNALRQGAVLALANKESMVAAGPLMRAAAQSNGAAALGRILPVDSEHSAVFQALHFENRAQVARVTLTASGGALRDWPLERLAKATVAEALNHPNWSMGARITIDSASMFNKALEVIEAREMFELAPEQIDVVVHRESVIHALVAFKDGAVMAHMGAPDMRHPIGYALYHPQREALPVAALDLVKLGRLHFEAPDEQRFPALRLAREVMAAGGLAGAAFNAAKEVALDRFLCGEIGFLDMAILVEATLERLSGEAAFGLAADDLTRILDMDALARVRAAEWSGASAGLRAAAKVGG